MSLSLLGPVITQGRVNKCKNNKRRRFLRVAPPTGVYRSFPLSRAVSCFKQTLVLCLCFSLGLRTLGLFWLKAGDGKLNPRLFFGNGFCPWSRGWPVLGEPGSRFLLMVIFSVSFWCQKKDFGNPDTRSF